MLYGVFVIKYLLPVTYIYLERFFIIALLSMGIIGMQNYLMGCAGTNVTSKLRALSFKAILRQDSTLAFCYRREYMAKSQI